MTEVEKIRPFKRLMLMLRNDSRDIYHIYLYAIFSGILSLSLPLGIQVIVNLLGGAQLSTSWVLLVTIIILGILFTGILQVMQMSLTETLQQKIFARAAFEFAYRIPSIRPENINRYNLPELVNRFFDTLSVQKGISKLLIDFSAASIQIFFGLLILSFYHPFFILFSLFLIVLVYLIIRYTVPRGLKTSLNESKYKYEVAHWLEEIAYNIKAFKMNAHNNMAIEKTDVLVDKYLKSRKAHFKVLVLQYFTLIGFKVIVAASLLVLGGLLVFNEQMNIGQFIAAEIIILLILGSVEKLVTSMETIYDVLTSVEKIAGVTDLELEKIDSYTTSITEIKSIRFNNIAYSNVNEVKVFDQFSLEVTKGNFTYIEDVSFKLDYLYGMMSGLNPVNEGVVYINDVPLVQLNKQLLRQQIACNTNMDGIFYGSVRENVCFNYSYMDEERLLRVCKRSGVFKYFEHLPEGWNTPVDLLHIDDEPELKERLLLARMLYHDGSIYLIKDTFNYIPEHEINILLKELMDMGKTIFLGSLNQNYKNLATKQIKL